MANESKPQEMWFYATSPDAEHWDGPADTLGDAIAEARESYDGNAERFWVDSATEVNWEASARAFADAEGLLESFADYIYDNENAEEPEPFFRVSKEAAQAELEAWAVKHLGHARYWQCDGNATEYAVRQETETGE